MEVLMNKEQIMEIIPHRDPFMLLDEIYELKGGVYVKAGRLMTPDDFWVKGHFPQEAVTPGVLMLEMLAQAGAVCVLSMPENKGKIGLLGSVKEAKFRRKVVPGDLLILEVEMTKIRGSVGVGKGLATVNGEKAVAAELTFALQ